MKRVTLSDNELEYLMNGTPIQKVLSDGTVISISQTMMKDATMPMVNHDKQIFSKSDIRNIKMASSIMSDAPISKF